MVPTPASQPSTLLKPLLAGGLMFALAGLLLDTFSLLPGRASSPTTTRLETCDTIIEADSQISREQLAQLLAVPERDSKARVQEIVAEPYCTLPTLEVRSGVSAERAAYPLAFDPTTQLVILYENDEYAGYRFSFE